MTSGAVLDIKTEPTHELWAQEVHPDELDVPAHYLASLGEEVAKVLRSDQIFLQCIGCTALFPSEESRLNHEMSCLINSDRKKLMCIYCNDATKTPSELRRHEARHCPPGSGTWCVCLFCHSRFETIYQLQKHKHSVHGPKKKAPPV